MNKKKNATDRIKSHVKCISSIVVGYGVGELVASALKDFKPDAKGIKKLAIKIGAVALTGMLVQQCTNAMNNEIDDIFEMVDGIIVGINAEKGENDEADN